jgi:hypothetical protein
MHTSIVDPEISEERDARELATFAILGYKSGALPTLCCQFFEKEGACPI